MSTIPHPAEHVVQHLHADKMSDSDLSERIAHSEWIVQQLGHLLQSGTVTHKALITVLAQAVQRGAIKPQDLVGSIAALPDEPQHLPAVVHHMREIASHAGTMAHAEQTYRVAPKN